MKIWKIGTLLLGAMGLTGCAVLGEALCAPECHTQTRTSSSLVEFLYPDGQSPPPDNAVPRVTLPLRVGLAFLPATGSNAAATLDAAHREQLLERIRARFKDKPFVSEIVSIPDYYLTGRRGFSGLEGVQRLYHVDLMALVSYDQVSHADDNAWSLGYLTIVGAYVINGTHHDVSTLIDMAVIDPLTRSLVLRAGGTATQQDLTNLINAERDTRQASNAGFSIATDQMIEHFDRALAQFEVDVRTGKSHIQVVSAHSGPGSGGGGALGAGWLLLLAAVALTRRQT